MRVKGTIRQVVMLDTGAFSELYDPQANISKTRVKSSMSPRLITTLVASTILVLPATAQTTTTTTEPPSTTTQTSPSATPNDDTGVEGEADLMGRKATGANAENQ